MLQETNNSMAIDRNQSEEQLDNMIAEIHALDNSLVAAYKETVVLRKDLFIKNNAIQSLNNRIQSLMQEKNTLQAEIDEIKTERDNLKHSMEILASEAQSTEG